MMPAYQRQQKHPGFRRARTSGAAFSKVRDGGESVLTTFTRRGTAACPWLVLVSLSLINSNGALSDRRPPGREIYRQQCAKCHGRAGQGVKGKYDDALHGDWPIDKLTRYIDRNMPEDAPDKCKGPDAAAVARYIYDAFYSREARLRNHPPRVELARLTNRQYVNAVADLIKRFTGSDRPTGDEHGLRASYFKSRNFRRDTNAFERVDRQVNFEFGESGPFNSPDRPPQPGGTNEFSMRWQGSLIADESGDHEFILKTPNGARLWVNDEDTPLIDAGVASGQVVEHKATLRLIGGRAYPLRLDFFKFKEKTAAIVLRWKPPHGVDEAIPARNLSPARVTPTFVVTTPFPPDDSSVGYERGVAVSKAWDEATTQAAIEAANFAVKRLDRLTNSKPKDEDRASKAEAFCLEFAETALRRPLTKDQKRLMVSAHFTSAPRAEDAVKRVVLLTLKSPRFLYLGLEGAKADDFTVAERLAFGLWDSLPDRELLKAAGDGLLRTRDQAVRQSNRMLADPRARAKMQVFLHHWLQMNHADDLSKDAQLFPGFTPEIVADLRASLNLFLANTVWSESSDYRELLLAEELYVNNRLALFYGVQTNAADDFIKVKYAPKERSGVLTHPYLLAAFSYPKSTSPIHRGVFLTRNIVGRALKPPPMAVAFKDEEFAPNLSMREKVEQLTRSQACQNCHSVINPLGFSLEHYDAVGRFRTREGERPINAASDYTTDAGEIIRLTGARDLANFAVNSEQAQNGFIEQLFHHVVKQPMLSYGAKTLPNVRRAFVESGFNIRQVLVEIAAVSALHGVGQAAQPSRR